MAEAFDVVVVGAGHNGLVTAAYLARARLRVLVLERRSVVGGAVTTEEIAPGFRGPTGATVCGLLRPEIIEDLGLARRGVKFLPVDPEVVVLGDGTSLRIWKDVRKAEAELAAISPKDAEAYPRFVEFLTEFAGALDPLLTRPPPNLVAPSLGEQAGLLRRALGLRRMGKAVMQRMLRLPPMSIRDALNEWFETELLKASFAVDALIGTFEGPWSPGTAFGLIPHFLPRAHGTAWSFVKGGMGNLASALASAARDAGVTIRTDASVQRIHSRRNRVTGVELASGEVINAKVVASNADPKHTFLHLDVYIPSTVDPDLAPSGKHVMSALLQYAPYELRRGAWDKERERLGDRVQATLENHLPGLGKLVVGRQVLTPVDLETRFGLTEGHIYHGEMTLDQSFVLRPVPGWSRYRTPVDGLYLCGAGAHPGGGITGAPGLNASRAILKDWSRLSTPA